MVSAIRLEGFRNSEGTVVHLPDAPQTIGGTRWIQRSGWINSQPHFENLNEPAPYILEQDEVVVIRFQVGPRYRLEYHAGIWTALRSFYEPLRIPIVAALERSFGERLESVFANDSRFSSRLNSNISMQVWSTN